MSDCMGKDAPWNWGSLGWFPGTVVRVPMGEKGGGGGLIMPECSQSAINAQPVV